MLASGEFHCGKDGIEFRDVVDSRLGNDLSTSLQGARNVSWPDELFNW